VSEEPLNRESILNGDMRKLAESQPGLVRLMSDEDRARWIDTTLSQAPSMDQIWVFAYGSLIWNPAFIWAEQFPCTIAGYHRSFCFWTRLGRGCEENPGLMMGLEPGGHCSGVAYRIDASKVDSEIDILFRRELISHAYIPTWVEAREANSNSTVQAITFVMDPTHERYCGGLDREQSIRHIATAKGPLGRNCDYLFSLVEHLQKLAFTDPELEQLAIDVAAFQHAHPDQVPPR
jgi:cation transport protein ChaC